MDLRGLRQHWAASAALPADLGRDDDRRRPARAGPRHPGRTPDGARRARPSRRPSRRSRVDLGRWGTGPIVILCGPGNNGGDGYVAARRLALAGASVVVAVVAADGRPRRARRRPRTGTASRATPGSSRSTLPVARDVAMFGLGIDKAAVVVDALLGTGVRGALREPIREAVEVIGRARAAGVPVVAVDTPTAVDLSSRRAVRPGGHRRPDRHLPSTEDGPADHARGALRGQDPRRARSASRPRPTVAEPRPVGRQPGWREVILVAVVAVAVVLGAAILTSILPTNLQEIVFHTPLAIVVLIVGTAWLLWRIARRPPGTARVVTETPADTGIEPAAAADRRHAERRDLGRRHRRWRHRRRRGPPRRRLARDACGARRAGRHRRRDLVALVAAHPWRAALPRAVPVRARPRGAQPSARGC